MTGPENLFERIRVANPVPVEVEPDWDRVTERLRAAGDRHHSGSLHSATPGVRRRRLGELAARRRRPATRVALAGAVLCAAAVAGILMAVAPWSGSPSFLARAAAALTPGAGTVLHERWEMIIAPEPGNPYRTQRTAFGPEQLWMQVASPNHYRTILEPSSTAIAYSGPAGSNFAATYGVRVSAGGSRGRLSEAFSRIDRFLAGKRPLELGGALELPGEKTPPHVVLPTLTFLPPRTLLRVSLNVTLGPSLPGPHDQMIENGTDPVSVLRAAIAEGRAQEAGSRQIDGRKALRIDFDLPKKLPADSPPLPANAPKFHPEAYAYVEPETFHPIEIVFGPWTYRFLAYEYLPATAANLALTSIQAQHPGAKVVEPRPRRG